MKGKLRRRHPAEFRSFRLYRPAEVKKTSTEKIRLLILEAMKLLAAACALWTARQRVLQHDVSVKADHVRLWCIKLLIERGPAAGG